MKKYFNLRPVPAYIITSAFVALVCGSTAVLLILRRDVVDELAWLAILPAALFLLWTVSAAVVFYKMHYRYNNIFKEILSTFPKEDVEAFMEYTDRRPTPEEISRWVCGKLDSYERARFNNMAALSGVSMSREIFWRISEQSMRLDFGDYWERTYGYTDLGKTKDIRLMLTPATRMAFNDEIKRIGEEIGGSFNISGQLELTAGKLIAVNIQGRSVKTPAGGSTVFMGAVYDTDLGTRLNERLKTEKRKLRFIQSCSTDVLYEVDVRENRLKSLNPRKAKEFFNIGDMQDFDGQRRPYWMLIHPDDREGFIDRFFNYDHMTIMPDEKMSYEYRVKNRDGDYIWVEHQAQVISAEDGKVNRIIGRISDITDRKRIVQKQQANVDALTGALLRTGVAREFEKPIYDGNSRCVTLFNITGFRHINNQYGYDSGDMVLKALVTVLWECQLGRCIVGRLDNDTFVAAMVEVSEKNSPQKMMEKVLERFRDPLTIGNQRTINIAVCASCSAVFTERCSFDEAYEQAELAMKACKRSASAAYSGAYMKYTDSLRERLNGEEDQ